MVAKKKEATKENPIEAFTPIKYVCSQWPYLRLGGGLKFEKGFLVVTDADQQKRVEGSESYKGKAIMKVQNKIGRKPSVEESAQIAALEALQIAGEQKVNVGMVSTRSL